MAGPGAARAARRRVPGLSGKRGPAARKGRDAARGRSDADARAAGRRPARDTAPTEELQLVTQQPLLDPESPYLLELKRTELELKSR